MTTTGKNLNKENIVPNVISKPKITKSATHSPNLLSIQNASKLINDKLFSKGYFSSNPKKLQKLLFLSTDYSDILNDYSTLEINETMYKNDKNIINIIYSLLNSLDQDNKSKESAIVKLSTKDREINVLRNEVKNLKSQLNSKETLIHSLKTDLFKSNLELKDSNLKIFNLSNKNNQLENNFKIYSDEVKRELRRNDFEIESLENKLTNTLKRKNITTTSTIINSKRPRLDNENLVNIIESNASLKESLLESIGFSLNVSSYIKKLNESIAAPPPQPRSFIPTTNDLLKLDLSKYNIKDLDQLYLNLIKSLDMDNNETSTIEDTFKFKKRKGALDKQVEIDNLNKRLKDMESNYERVLKIMENWKSFRNDE